MKHFKAALLTAALALTTPMALAGEVTLRSHDGSISMTGEIVAYDGSTFTIRSAIGEVKVDSSTVDCIGDDCPAVGVEMSDFTVSGSRVVGGSLLPALIQAYALEQNAETVQNAGDADAISMTFQPQGEAAGSEITLRLNNSAGGLADLIAGTADIALLSRPLDAAETESLAAAGLATVRQDILALDGLVPIVAASNPLKSISEQDLASVFSAGVVNWSDLGGADAPITLYMREPGSGSRGAFDQIVMSAFIAVLADTATILTSDEAIADAVAADPNGIGVVSMTEMRNAKALPILGICGIETPATALTIKTEEYPLTRRLTLMTRGSGLSAGTQALIDFALSDSAQFDIADAGFVDQAIEATPVAEQGLRFATAMMPGLSDTTLESLQALAADLMPAQRLSTTFRFDAEGQPDARATADIARLAQFLQRPEMADKEVLIAGFTDNDGSMSRNRELATTMARQISDALLAALPEGVSPPLTLTPKGFGETAPLACNEIASGRAVNRRVEIWIRDLPNP